MGLDGSNAIGRRTCEHSVALLTFVLQAHHCIILEDWINFFDHPIEEMVVHVGSDEAVISQVHEICERHDIKLRHLGVTTARETTEDEARLLATQFDAVTSDFACVIRLDTLPYRQEGLRWQDGAMELLHASGAFFLTGGALPFRADRPTIDDRYRMTQRISNCFMIIRPQVWKELQVFDDATKAKYGRFLVEGAVEDNLAKRNLWGVRLLNSSELRVFHCQEWSLRLLLVRDKFRQGKHIQRYLEGFQDDRFGANAQNYLEPKPPTMRRIRILLGRWRLQLFGDERR